MDIEVCLTSEPIPERAEFGRSRLEGAGSLVEFRGIVRGEEEGEAIQALNYEAYESMAVNVIREILSELSAEYPCRVVRVIHRHGRIPVGEAAIYVGVCSKHRREGIGLLADFMDRLKRDVPIWKAGVIV